MTWLPVLVPVSILAVAVFVWRSAVRDNNGGGGEVCGVCG